MSGFGGCFDFERMRLHWNGCGLILHEFCHLIHQFCLGLDCEKVEELYTEACTSGRYDKTLRRDWAGRNEDWDMAYALVDFKEFFAEMTESYVGVNDFYPFVRAELQEHDPKTYALMEKIWGKF